MRSCGWSELVFGELYRGEEEDSQLSDLSMTLQFWLMQPAIPPAQGAQLGEVLKTLTSGRCVCAFV